MIKNVIDNSFFKSLSYIFVSGASKGFNYIILLYLAVGVYLEYYVTILLLMSMEQILSLLLPLNQSSVIYSKTIVDYKSITNKLLSSSLLITLLCIVVFLVTKELFYSYFGTHKIIVFMSIFISMIINSYLTYLTNYYKLIEKHGKALLIQGLLMISFGSILLHIIFVEDKVVAFFLGKSVGLLLVLVFVTTLNLTKFKFEMGFLSLKEIKQVLNLFSVSTLGWISGLGFMNLAKIYSTPTQLTDIGYVLNIFNVFLLISIGINSVYGPLIKKNITNNNLDKVIKIKNKTLIIYLSIAIIIIIFYLVFQNLNLSFNDRIVKVTSALPFAVLLYVFNVFHWVSQPFYMVNNKFNNYNYINIISYVIWAIIIIVGLYFEYKTFIIFLILIHLIKGLLSYFYAKIKFMNTTS
ncbi:hypothetical protein J1D01_00425 [Seonamhaeicola sp. NFXS20]|uniref:hypothetical protein n=1 Tax=Seonamhaeicola sp. NFXS20 TaxID=2816959 RepID=UPI003B8DC65A